MHLNMSSCVCVLVSMRVCVCHRWYNAGDFWLLRWPKHHCPVTFVSTLFLKAWVGGEGWREDIRGRRRRNEKGRKERRRADDGKWPPPRCHMGGGLKESVLCCSRWIPHERKPILPFVSSPSHLLFPLVLSFNVPFSHLNFLTFYLSLSNERIHTALSSTHTQTGLKSR